MSWGMRRKQRKTRMSITKRAKSKTGDRCDRREFLEIAKAALAAGCAGSVLSSACSGPSSSSAPIDDVSGVVVKTGTPVVALFTTLANDFFRGYKASGEQAARAFGLEFEFYVNNLRPEIQLAQQETKLGAGAKMMTIVPPTQTSTQAYARKAKEFQCATTIMHETPAWYFPYQDGDYWVYYQIVDGIRAGYAIARRLFEEMGGRGKLLFIQGFPGITSDRLRTGGMMKALKEYPDIELLGSLAGNWNRIDARRAMEDLMTRFPEFDAVYCNNDDMAIGVLTAIEEAGKKRVPIVGTDAVPEFMQRIKEGRLLASCAIHPCWSGAYQVARAYDIANGWVPSIPERMMFYGFDVIDEQNIDVYYERYVTNLDGLGFDFRRMSRVLYPEDWDPQNSLRPIVPEELWEGVKKPSAKAVPDSWKKAQKTGEMDRVAKEYAQHYQRKIM